MWQVNWMYNVIYMRHVNESILQSIFDENEYQKFLFILKEVCDQDKDVLGVLITGSFTQNLQLPDPKATINANAYNEAYKLILNKQRRRIFPSRSSDLDIWVLTKDPYPQDIAERVKSTLEDRSIELVQWLAENMHSPNYYYEWINRKQKAFNEFYKQNSMYSEAWIKKNPEYPWRGGKLKRAIIRELESSLPRVVNRINHNFEKKIPGEFFELRSYPTSVFNLRPEEIMVEGKIDKTPFPFPLDDLVDLNDNCYVLYAREESKDELIYPFNSKGEILNERLQKLVRRDDFV